MELVWNNQVTYKKFFSQIGSISLDATLEDSHSMTATATTHPIETGSNISDHVHTDPRVVTIIGVISNHPIGLPPSQAEGVREVQKEFEWKADPIIPLIQVGGPGIIGGVTGAIASEIGADLHKGTALGFEPVFDRVADVLKELEAIWVEGRVITIVTTLKVYDNMVIESLEITRTPGQGQAMAFTATARQIAIVETGVVPAPADPTVERAKPESPQGKQSSTALDDSNPAAEVTHSVADKLAGIF